MPGCLPMSDHIKTCSKRRAVATAGSPSVSRSRGQAYPSMDPCAGLFTAILMSCVCRGMGLGCRFGTVPAIDDDAVSTRCAVGEQALRLVASGLRRATS